MTLKTIESIKPGELFYCNGFLFRVKATKFDPRGRPDRYVPPRYILLCEQIDGDELPEPLRSDFRFSKVAGTPIEIQNEPPTKTRPRRAT